MDYFIIVALPIIAVIFYLQGREDGYTKAVRLEKQSFSDNPTNHVNELAEEAGYTL